MEVKAVMLWMHLRTNPAVGPGILGGGWWMGQPPCQARGRALPMVGEGVVNLGQMLKKVNIARG